MLGIDGLGVSDGPLLVLNAASSDNLLAGDYTIMRYNCIEGLEARRDPGAFEAGRRRVLR